MEWLDNVFGKWTRGCETLEQLADLMVTEQLLNTLPLSIKIWVEERRLKTAEKAAQLANNYIRACKQTSCSQRTRQCCKELGHFAIDCPQGSRKSQCTTTRNWNEPQHNNAHSKYYYSTFPEDIWIYSVQAHTQYCS